jgi:hypothetical protein
MIHEGLAELYPGTHRPAYPPLPYGKHLSGQQIRLRGLFPNLD